MGKRGIIEDGTVIVVAVTGVHRVGLPTAFKRVVMKLVYVLHVKTVAM
jgi:hypothetical protein